MKMRIIALPLVVTLLCSCNVPLRIGEVARVSSPSARLDAIVIEANTGSNSGSSYDVFLVPSTEPHSKGVHVASLFGATRNEIAYGVNLKWNSADELAIEYLKASAAEVLEPHPKLQGENIHIVLRDGIEDASAPPGIMLDNLRVEKSN